MTLSQEKAVIETENLEVIYGKSQALHSINVKFFENRVTAIIGPSGCGKSTLLRSLNRMNEFALDISIRGTVYYDGLNIYSNQVDPAWVRQSIGMVFQRPNPFPKSIYGNIVWGPKINGIKADLDELVETSLKRAALWDEVKDRLHQSALGLSGGQQQRLCIARAIAMSPRVILMDEPCSALDPKGSSRIEDLIIELKSKYTICIVTHNMQQAARVSDYTAFMYEGILEEFDFTKKLFTTPKSKRTEDYITGRFG
jgi:phosphate transport system ATP-binding protein